MRKALIATIVAMVLFAVGAFAANLTLNAEDAASGKAEVKACGSATVDLVADTWDNTANDWLVTSAKVKATNGDGDCSGAIVRVVVKNGTSVGESDHATEVKIAADGTATVNFSGGNRLPVNGISGAGSVSVLLDGVPA
jgi:hypothetical protein